MAGCRSVEEMGKLKIINFFEIFFPKLSPKDDRYLSSWSSIDPLLEMILVGKCAFMSVELVKYYTFFPP
jgi:hypothetical protein